MSAVLVGEMLLHDGTSVRVLHEQIAIARAGNRLIIPMSSARALAAVLAGIAVLTDDPTPDVAATPAPSVQEDGAHAPAPTAGATAGVAESSPPSSSATPDRGHIATLHHAAATPAAAAAAARRRRRPTS